MIGEGGFAWLSAPWLRRTQGDRVRRLTPPVPGAGGGLPVVASRVLPAFLAALARTRRPVLIDLGPAVGPNVAFFGERLACKIIVEDLFADIERAAGGGGTAALVDRWRERFAGRAATADGVLCWDVFDYLDRPAAETLARGVAQALRPGGVALGWFATSAAACDYYTRFVILDDRRLEPRPYPAPGTTRRVWPGRQIANLFAGLDVAEQVWLKTNRCEVLLRKP